MRQNFARVAWNRGILSPLAAARIDLARHAISADLMVNWMPRVLGSMSIRPGLGYIGSTAGNDQCRGIPFVRATDNVARLEVTSGGLRVWVDDALVTRVAVTAVVTNGGFDIDLTGWTDSDEAGAASTWAVGGYLSLVGSGSNAAIRDQTVTVNEPNVEHALRIIVERGPLLLRVGSTAGGEEYIGETTLGTGTHSLAFTPTGADFRIRFSNVRLAASLVDSVAVEAAGVLSLPTPWAATDLNSLRWVQSADVLFVASSGFQQRKIERRSDTSWSLVLYEPEDGPFRLVNLTPITIAASGLTGDVTLTASKSLFRSGMVGGLFRITSSGQLVTTTITGANQFTESIRVVGVGGQRAFSFITTGVWAGTVTLQYSVDEGATWVDATSYTTNQALSYNDELDNQVLFYRLGIKAGNYTSGTAVATLAYSSGSAVGVARITGYTSETVASASVIDSLGGTDATDDWNEGSWSGYRGFPTAVALHEGRMWWAGRDKQYGSISDLYESFDDTIEGDSGPIQRSIGEGPVNKIHWLMSLSRLLMGTAGMSADVAAARIDGNTPVEARSSSFDLPLTPTNFNLKYGSSRAVFVDRSGIRLYESAFDIDANGYNSTDLSLLAPELNNAGIVGIAIQHKPDVRVHCWRSDGTVGVLIYDRAENVVCWCEVETDGEVEDVVVLPGEDEDQVYYTVKRVINHAAVRYHEKWALESECLGQPEARLADAFVVFESPSGQVTTITGADHLESETVKVWGWNTVVPFTNLDGDPIGRDLGSFVVSGGQITGLPSLTNACYGLGYTARWRGTKNAFGDQMGTPLGQSKRLEMVGLMLKDTHGQGLRYGQDFEHLSEIPQADLPASNDSPPVPDLTHIFTEYEGDMMSLNGTWDTDSRLCLEAAAPRPVTLLAAVLQMMTNG